MSSMLLEILGKAVNIDTAELIQHWFDATRDKNQGKWLGEYKELNKVVELIGEQKFEKAHEQLRFYLFEKPSCTKGRLAAGQLCLYNNQLKDAIEQFNSVYFREPNNTMALYALGHCYERLGRESEAIEFYQDCLKFKNYLQLPRQRLAAIYYKNSQIEKTTIEYEELRKEYPDDISVLVTLGYLYMLHCKHEAAIEAFNTAILIHPDNFQGQEDELDELVGNCQFNEAIEVIDGQLENEPDRIDLILKKGDIYNMLGQCDDAIDEYRKAIKIRPDFLEATIKLGTCYLHTQNDELAAMEYNNALEINDRIVDAYIGLAIAQKAAGKISEAISTLSLTAAIV
ncbi:MAG TPA: tetratricopeptide repeat protein, partial [Sedimentisphaerales bacterium]|nr:tetratricopeptide repeat protein [Sedimentisphaerales bacterium]